MPSSSSSAKESSSSWYWVMSLDGCSVGGMYPCACLPGPDRPPNFDGEIVAVIGCSGTDPECLPPRGCDYQGFIIYG